MQKKTMQAAMEKFILERINQYRAHYNDFCATIISLTID